MELGCVLRVLTSCDLGPMCGVQGIVHVQHLLYVWTVSGANVENKRTNVQT